MENWLYPLPCAAYVKSVEPQVITFSDEKLAAYSKCFFCLLNEMVIQSFNDGTCELRTIAYIRGLSFEKSPDDTAVCGFPLPEVRE